MIRQIIKLIFSIVTLFVLQFCQNPEEIQPESNIRIINNEEELNSRMTLSETPVPVVAENGKIEKGFSLVLSGELEPPKIDGKLLQATCAEDYFGEILVSYNYSGAEYAGALDYIDSRLVVKSEILFSDADINHFTGNGKDLYFVGSKAGQDVPAFAEKISLEGNSFAVDNMAEIPLGCYAANSIYNDGQYLYISTGDDESKGGGIYKVSYAMDIVDYTPAHDSRWITESNGDLYIAQGTPGQITKMNSSSLEELATISFNGANVAESKTTIDIADNRIFIAGGPDGVLVYDLEGNYLNTVTFSDPDAITNAVAADGGLLFISNGEAGAYVATYNQSNISEQPVVLGILDFGQHISVNHIYFRGTKLYIAAGLGGVKLVKVSK